MCVKISVSKCNEMNVMELEILINYENNTLFLTKTANSPCPLGPLIPM